jgi:hypothetical protein
MQVHMIFLPVFFFFFLILKMKFQKTSFKYILKHFPLKD